MNFSLRTSLCLAAASAFAAPLALEPGATLFENDQVRVVRALDKPHNKGSFHEHKVNRVMIYLQDAKQRFEYQDGRKPAVFDWKANQVVWSPPEGMHSPEIISDTGVNIVEIELKKKGTGKKITAKLDPPKVDPKHYKVELENDQVRVIRGHMGPHDSVKQHEHSLNRVTVYLTEQNIQATDASGKVDVLHHKAGEASWGTPLTHKEKNLNASAFDVVIVEIKD